MKKATFRHSFPAFAGFVMMALMSFVSSQAQDTLPQIGSVIPASPNAASLGKFGEIPVGYYTGIPEISVPIYEINTGTIKLPISLGYHAGGIRVEEVASWVGTGWALNAGGVITRQQRGLPDEYEGRYQYVHDKIAKYTNGLMGSTEQQNYLDSITDGTIDSQMDLFTYNIGGESGKFILDTLGNVVTMPNSRNKFEFDNVNWKITDINGTQYFFQTKESTQSYAVTNGTLPPNPQPSGTGSWYITKIVNALGTDSINFVYEVAETNFESNGTQTIYTGSGCSKDMDYTYTTNTVNGWRLTGIYFKNGSVLFNKDTAHRCDYSSDYALSSIVIKSTDSAFYKKYVLHKSYICNNISGCATGNEEYNRLFLDSLAFFDRNDSL
ncbi:MAG TPA: hypothetical protein VGM41_18745, partial [Chitinophagaceae bacterium]